MLSLKQSGNVLLHSICVELGKITLQENILKVHIPNFINYETLKKPQNYANLVESLAKLGYNLSIELVLDETASNTKASKKLSLEKILGFSIETI